MMGKNAAVTQKDIFTIPNSVILQVCNIAGGFGSGFAGQVAKKYPHVKKNYKFYFKQGVLHLGEVTVDTLTDDQWLVNLLAMPDYRRPGEPSGKCYLDYDSLDKALIQFNTLGKIYHPSLRTKIPVLPYLMGCGNAGGDWSKVSELLDKHLDFYIVCKRDD